MFNELNVGWGETLLVEVHKQKKHVMPKNVHLSK